MKGNGAPWQQRSVSIWRSSACCFVLTIVVVLLFLSQGVEAGTQETLSGWLTNVWGDGKPGSRLPSEVVSVLTDSKGQTTRLILSSDVLRQAGGLATLDRRRVIVRGEWAKLPLSQETEPVLWVQSIELASDELPAAVRGSQPWIFILCKFSDVFAEPRSLSYFQTMLGNAYPYLDHYWREVSYNTANIVGSRAVGWYTLPGRRASYLVGNPPMLDHTRIAQDCTAAADPAVDFRNYVGINLIFNDELDGYAWGGARTMTLDGVTRIWYMTWEPPWGYTNLTALVHEMGHGFGMPHSSGDYGQTYDNVWDVMSDAWGNCAQATDSVYGCLGQHTIAYHKDKLEWMPAGSVHVAVPGRWTTLTLQYASSPQSGSVMLVKLPFAGSTSRFVTVEARRRQGYDAKLPADGVIIHNVDTTRSAPAHVVDIDGNGNTGDEGAIWRVGETYTDPVNRVTIAVVAENAVGYVVSFGLGVTPTPYVTPTPVRTATPTAVASSPLTITGVRLVPTVVESGDVLQVEIGVRNDSSDIAGTQGPEPGLVYEEGDSAESRGYPDVLGAWRVGIDHASRLDGRDHPYRWGLGTSLLPGTSVTVTGYIRLTTPRTTKYWAGVVQERTRWWQDGIGTTTVTVVAASTPTPTPTSGRTVTSTPSPSATPTSVPTVTATATPPGGRGGTLTITGVRFVPTVLAVGNVLQVEIGVRNDGLGVAATQGPSPWFVYEERDSADSRGYPDVLGRWRVGLDFAGRSGGKDHPYRWGLGSDLAPGQSVTVTGAIRLTTARSVTYWAGLVQEGVRWWEDNQGTTLITVGSVPAEHDLYFGGARATADALILQCTQNQAAQKVWRVGSWGTSAQYLWTQSLAPGEQCGEPNPVFNEYPLVISGGTMAAYGWVTQCAGEANVRRVWRAGPDGRVAAFLYPEISPSCP